MTQAPEWFCPPGHPRETQLRRQWADLARDRRRGGRALASWSSGLDRLAAEHEEHKRKIGEVGATLDRIEAVFAAEQGRG